VAVHDASSGGFSRLGGRASAHGGFPGPLDVTSAPKPAPSARSVGRVSSWGTAGLPPASARHVMTPPLRRGAAASGFGVAPLEQDDEDEGAASQHKAMAPQTPVAHNIRSISTGVCAVDPTPLHHAPSAPPTSAAWGSSDRPRFYVRAPESGATGDDLGGGDFEVVGGDERDALQRTSSLGLQCLSTAASTPLRSNSTPATSTFNIGHSPNLTARLSASRSDIGGCGFRRDNEGESSSANLLLQSPPTSGRRISKDHPSDVRVPQAPSAGCATSRSSIGNSSACSDGSSTERTGNVPLLSPPGFVCSITEAEAEAAPLVLLSARQHPASHHPPVPSRSHHLPPLSHRHHGVIHTSLAAVPEGEHGGAIAPTLPAPAEESGRTRCNSGSSTRGSAGGIRPHPGERDAIPGSSEVGVIATRGVDSYGVNGVLFASNAHELPRRDEGLLSSNSVLAAHDSSRRPSLAPAPDVPRSWDNDGLALEDV
jgi:hypothetical protein